MKSSVIIFVLTLSMAVACTTSKSNNNNNTNNFNNATCGNGVIDLGEVCDGVNLAGQTCLSQSFTSGVLQCAANCLSFDTSWCEGTMNNVNNTNNWTPPANSRVYVHTEFSLYYIDPGESDQMVLVGEFNGICRDNKDLNRDSMFYDIALDQDRNMVGITAKALYRINKETAECTLLRQFPTDPVPPNFFALSYVKGVDTSDLNRDVLMGATAEDGEWVEIDAYAEDLNSIFVSHGYYDPPNYDYVSSGDIVSVQTGLTEYHTYATLKCAAGYTGTGCTSDVLAEIDPATGDARIIGETGYQRIFALGFWGDKVYGFTKQGEYILIDVDTAEATEISSDGSFDYWGAGNTTRPYIVE
ncbi:hypothetical protein KKD52_09030 [Myxococcota bacterium]|nr:hypothetical protein [Myxococcota bacterium]MBU1413826.1 hypothetical protein [Myxococcota bacterium]MBU1510490.1 hypothetical protein [Myxococcota bacterium]